MASEMLKKALIVSADEEYFHIDNLCKTTQWEPSEQFLNRTSALIAKTKKRHSGIMRKVLLTAAVILILSVMTVFSFAQVRDSVINFFKEYYITHFELEYGINEAGDISADSIRTVYTFASLPEGFQEISVTENDHSVITVFENAQGDTIILSQGDGMTKRDIDVERLIKTEIVSDGTIYEVYTEDDYSLILWNTDKYTFSMEYFGNEKLSHIVELAKNLKGEEK